MRIGRGATDPLSKRPIESVMSPTPLPRTNIHTLSSVQQAPNNSPYRNKPYPSPHPPQQSYPPQQPYPPMMYNPMSSMAFMGMGMGMGGGGGIIGTLYSINYFINSLSMMYQMNSAHIAHSYNNLKMLLCRVIKIAKESKLRLFLQRKSKKSKVLKFLFVIIAMFGVSQTYRLLRLLWQEYSKQNNSSRMIEDGSPFGGTRRDRQFS